MCSLRPPAPSSLVRCSTSFWRRPKRPTSGRSPSSRQRSSHSTARRSTTTEALEWNEGLAAADARRRHRAGCGGRVCRPPRSDRRRHPSARCSNTGAGMAIARAHDGGTNAVAMRPAGAVMTHFGEQQSAAVHAQTTAAAGLAARIIDLPGLAFDVDTPDDLDELSRWAGPGRHEPDARLQGLGRAVRAARAARLLRAGRAARARLDRRLRPLPALAPSRRAQPERARLAGRRRRADRTRAAGNERAHADDALPTSRSSRRRSRRSPASTLAASSSASAPASR